MMTRSVHLIIHGRVQGVWYRAWTVETATKFSLTGWVRNRKDGTVEAVLSGEEAVVDQMITACYQGPPAARIDNIEMLEFEKAEEFPDFQSRPTV